MATYPWLEKHHVSRQLVGVYKKGGWLRSVGRGAFVRLGEEVRWTSAMYALQEQLHLPIHAGGKTALELKGYAHFLPLGKRPRVFLFGARPAKLPSWFRQHDWGVDIEYLMTNLFPEKMTSGLTGHDLDSYSISVSTPERAIMEVLSLVPQRQTFDEARLLMEGLTTLRPQLVQELLESCRSIKTKRVFLFLAEECRHRWIKQLEKNNTDLGKGKRSLIPGGRLDPIYNITVPQGAFSDERRQVQAFLNNRRRSPATRLMVPENARQILFGPAQGAYVSVAFKAYGDGKLDRLDELVRKFGIEKRGKRKFKGNLKENWLETVEEGDVDKIRNGANNTKAALVELVVADEQQRRRFEVTHLSAWDDENPDISCCKSGHELNIEVKYIGALPAFAKRVDHQVKSGTSGACWWDDERASFNYFAGRIAEAAHQLQKQKKTFDSRQVWLVFESFGSIRRFFEGVYLKKPGSWPDRWYKDTPEQKEVLAPFEKEIITGSPCEGLKKIPTLVLATMRDWYLEDIVEYKTKDLIR